MRVWLPWFLFTSQGNSRQAVALLLQLPPFLWRLFLDTKINLHEATVTPVSAFANIG